MHSCHLKAHAAARRAPAARRAQLRGAMQDTEDWRDVCMRETGELLERVLVFCSVCKHAPPLVAEQQPAAPCQAAPVLPRGRWCSGMAACACGTACAFVEMSCTGLPLLDHCAWRIGVRASAQVCAGSAELCSQCQCLLWLTRHGRTKNYLPQPSSEHSIIGSERESVSRW